MEVDEGIRRKLLVYRLSKSTVTNILSILEKVATVLVLVFAKSKFTIDVDFCLLTVDNNTLGLIKGFTLSDNAWWSWVLTGCNTALKSISKINSVLWAV